MDKHYTSVVAERTPLPRSKRLREAGVAGSSSSSSSTPIGDFLTEAEANDLFITKSFFNQLFKVHVGDDTDYTNMLLPNSNEDENTTYTIEAMHGLWSRNFLSSLGLNSQGGGGGGGDVSSVMFDTSISYHTGTPVYTATDGVIHLPPYPTSLAWSAITGKPTTIGGYGITDAKIANGVITLGSNTITPLTSSSNIAWSKITSTPTTISGYSITDAKIASGVITLGGNTITPVTSVGMTVPTGFSVSGSPISKTGTLAVTYANGYEGFTTTLKEKIETLYSWFEADADGNIKTKDKPNGTHRGFYSESFVSALGSNSSGGGGGGDVSSVMFDTSISYHTGTPVYTATDGVIHLPPYPTSVAWANVTGKPSWIGSSKPTYAIGEIQNSALSGNGFLKKTGTNTWGIDTNTYITGNQTITLSGDVSGSGATSISVTIGQGKVTNAMLAGSIANGKLQNSSVTVNGTSVSLGDSITTEKWGTARNITIKDADSTNSGTAVSVNGSAAVTLLLPSTIKASLTGNATSASKLNTGTTTYTAWGQTYWSSGVPQDVSGSMYMNNNNVIYWKDNPSSGTATNMSILEFSSSNNLHVGYGSAAKNYNTYISGYAVYLRYGASRISGITLASTGAVTIAGATTLSSSLSVAGGITLTTTKKIYFGDTSHYLELDSTGFHFSHGVYSDSFVSALGANSSGGGGGGGTVTGIKLASNTSAINPDANGIVTIPAATTSAFGVVKVGSTLSVSSGTINLKASGVTAGTYRSVTVDTYGRVTDGTNPTTLSGYGITDAYTKTASDGRFMRISDYTDIGATSSNTVSCDTLTTYGVYKNGSTSTASSYVTERPVNSATPFRLVVERSSYASNPYIRQRYQSYNSSVAYERYSTDTGANWSDWVKVQGNLDNYLPLSGGQMTGALTWKNANALSGVTSTSYVLCIDAFADGGATHYILTSNLSVGNATNATNAATATKATQDGSGNVITSTYLTAIGRSGDYLTQTKGGTTSNVTKIFERRGTYSHAISEAGWYRVGRFSAKGSGGTSCIMMISKSFANNGNVAYVFSITLSYMGGISITQLAGDYYSTSLIDKIRVEYLNNNDDFYPPIDIHISTTASATNTYYVTFIGGAQALSEYEKDPTLTGSTFEFATTIGMKAATPSTHSTYVCASNTNGSVGVCASTNRGLIDVTNNAWIVGTNGTNTWLSQGNVGIGNTDPAYTLDVNGNTYSYGYIYLGRNNYGLYTKDSGGNVRNTVNLNSSNQLLIGYGTGGAGYETHIYGGSIYLRYGTSRTIGITLNSSGAATFAGTIEAKTNAYNYTTDATSYGLNMHNSDIINVNGIFGSDTQDSWTEGINFKRTNSNWDSIRVKDSVFYFSSNNSDGGTVSESVQLVPQAGGSDIAVKLVGSSYTMSLMIGSGNTNRGIYDHTNSKWALYFNASNTILNYGNVGIGTTSPGYKLGVVGTVGISSGHLYLTGASASSSTANTTQIIFTASSTQQVAISSNSSALIINPTSSTTTGQVVLGVGTTNSTFGTNIISKGEVTAQSDARKKNIISDTKFNVKDIAAARSVLFEWNDGRDKDKEKKIHGGSIAQDWLGKADSFLMQDEDGFYSINYGALALCSAITIARMTINHEDRITLLEKENAKLKARVAELEERRIA